MARKALRVGGKFRVFFRGVSGLGVLDACIHAQYDWTTGALDNGNEWRKFLAVPRLYPLRSLGLYFVSKGWKQKGF